MSRPVDAYSTALNDVATSATLAEGTALNVRNALAACIDATVTWNTNNPNYPILVPTSITDIFMEIFNAIINAEGFLGQTGITVNKLADIIDLLAALDEGQGN